MCQVIQVLRGGLHQALCRKRALLLIALVGLLHKGHKQALAVKPLLQACALQQTHHFLDAVLKAQQTAAMHAHKGSKQHICLGIRRAHAA